MWVCLSNSFLSIVEPSKFDVTDDKLLVRARRKGDIENVFPNAKVQRTPGRDYLFRAFIDRTEVAEALAQQAMNIGYGNFKNSVGCNELHNAYSGFWSIMARLQVIPPYGTARRGRNQRQGDLL